MSQKQKSHSKISDSNEKNTELSGKQRGMKTQLQNLDKVLRGYRQLFEKSGYGIIQYETDGQILEFNKSTYTFLGYTKGEFSQLKFHDLHSDSLPKPLGKFLEGITSEELEFNRCKFVRKNGESIKAENFYHVINLKGKKVLQEVINLNQKKPLSNESLNSPKFLQSIIRAVPDIIYRLDTESRITYINEVIREYGYDPEDLIGKNIFDLVHPDDRDRAKFRVNERRTGERRTRHFEIRLKAKNRKYVPFDIHTTGLYVEPTFLLEAEGIYNSDQPNSESFAGSQGVARDITDKKLSEKILIDSEKKLKSILSSMVDTIFVFDSKGIITTHQCHSDSNYLPAEKFLGKSVRAVFPKNVSRIFKEAMRENAQGNLHEAEYSIQQNGNLIWYSSKISPSLFDGKYLGSVAVIRDISERKVTEESIQRQNLQQEQLLKTIKYLNESLNLKEVLTRIAKTAKEILKADGCTIYLLEPDGKNLIPVVSIDPKYQKQILSTTLKVDDSLTGKSILKGKGCIFNHAEDISIGHQIPGTPENEVEHIIAAPFITGSKILGAVCLDRKKVTFTEEDLRLTEAFATVAATALKNAKAHSDLEAEIEEKKIIAKALSESEEKFRNLAEQSPNMIFINVKGRIAYANKKCEEIMGFKQEEFYNSDFKFLNLIAPESIQKILSNFKKHIAGQELQPYEYTLLTKSGKRIESIITTKLIIFEGEQAILGIITDIRDRKKAEEALRRSEEKYRKFFEEDLTGDYISSPEGKLLACNAAFLKIFGFKSRQQALKSNLVSLYPSPADRVKFLRELNKKKKLEYFEMELRRCDGKPVFTIANVSGKFSKTGVLQEIRGYLFDNTEQKILEQQFRQAQKMEAIGRLAGGVAHDFNNLLTIINGYSELLLHRLPQNHTSLKDIRQIKQAGDKASRLTNQLLAFSRRQVMQPKLINLNTVVRDVNKMLYRLIGEDIELLVNLDSKLGTIKADPGQLEQVIMNLAVNARDAMPGGGRLIVETANVEFNKDYFHKHLAVQPAGKYTMLSVADAGSGMDEDTQAHIFEPFFTTKAYGKGTGLGLSTVYGIVKQSGGFIWVDSELGKGTTFRIYFPTIFEEAKDLPDNQITRKSLAGHETILLVEDEEMVRELSARILKDKGYKVLEASRGEKALEVARKFSKEIHLMVTDVVMPGISGKKLAQEIKIERPELQVLFISGYTDDILSNSNNMDKGLFFLQKPFLPDHFLSKVRKILDTTKTPADHK